MDPSAALILNKLGVSYNQFIRYQWDHVLAKHVCTYFPTPAGSTKVSNIICVQLLTSCAALLLYSYVLTA